MRSEVCNQKKNLKMLFDFVRAVFTFIDPQTISFIYLKEFLREASKVRSHGLIERKREKRDANGVEYIPIVSC